MNIVKNGLYSVSDKYFEDFRSEYFCDNKSENRPYYVSYIDNDNITWLIPLSTQTENYKKKIQHDEMKHKICLFYHIGNIMGKERVFLIGNMFPVTEKYIKKPYTFSNVHYIIRNEDLLKGLNKRAAKYLLLVKQGKLRPKIDIMAIHKILKEQSLITL